MEKTWELKLERNVGGMTKLLLLKIIRNDFDIFVVGSKCRVLIQNTINSKLPAGKSLFMQRIDGRKGWR